MFDSILPIGQTCNITFLLQNTKIKKQTTLFEWFVSPNLTDITDILTKIVNNKDDNILHEKNSNIFMGDNIYSSHYKLEIFKPIYQRRRDRLLDIILSSKKIIFCRFDCKIIEYSKEDIDNFINIVRKINKNLLEIKLLLITPGIKLEHPCLVKVLYNKHNSNPFCKSPEINNLFINSLQKIGYNIKDTVNICFDDKSNF
jgi:hypothetical protein